VYGRLSNGDPEVNSQPSLNVSKMITYGTVDEGADQEIVDDAIIWFVLGLLGRSI
jgi:hypothetical protein